jgi:hypothetical protein
MLLSGRDCERCRGMMTFIQPIAILVRLCALAREREIEISPAAMQM